MSTIETLLERGLPASVDAERSILGAILLDNEAFDEAAEHLEARDFLLDSHQRIFACVEQLIASEVTADIVTVSNLLRDKRMIESVGGVAYIASLTEGLPRKIALGSYIRLVEEKSKLRKIITACTEAIERAQDDDRSHGIISTLEDGMEAVLADAEDNPLVSAYTVSALDEFERQRRLTASPGLSFGIHSLDEFTGGMRDGEVTVVGARSGVGKTSLLCQTAVANCQAGIPCHLFSLEMTRAQILGRLWSIVSGVSYKRVTDPWLSGESEAQAVRQAAQEVAEWPLRIHDQSDLPLSKIVAMAKLSIHRHGTRFIGVDYAQEVDAPGKDERTKVMMTARKLARLVKHEKASLMLLSQLIKTRREDYGRPPVVGDLIESGKLENVAHIVLLLHRGWDEEAARISEDAELLVPKQRRGDTGVLRAKFNRRLAIFEGA